VPAEPSTAFTAFNTAVVWVAFCCAESCAVTAVVITPTSIDAWSGVTVNVALPVACTVRLVCAVAISVKVIRIIQARRIVSYHMSASPRCRPREAGSGWFTDIYDPGTLIWNAVTLSEGISTNRRCSF